MPHAENHFGGLLESDATRKIVDQKIDSILARPEGILIAAPKFIGFRAEVQTRTFNTPMEFYSPEYVPM